MFKRMILLVLDSVGIGAMPDADEWGDAGADTLGHILAAENPQLPEIQKLGLGNIRELPNLPPAIGPAASFGRAAIFSNGKDTTVGHWEMAGMVTAQPFPTYPNGFPARILDPFKAAIGREVLGNRTASGTEIINELGAEHIRTGNPIIYTSADSVFQIAAHEEAVPLEELYRFCRIVRAILDGPDRVARVIARPFVGTPGGFRRTGNRRDFAIPPPGDTLLDFLEAAGISTIGIGKVPSIFDYIGFTTQVEAQDNAAVIDQVIRVLDHPSEGFVFANLGDFDMLWGHRRDSRGYARGLEYFDRRIPEILETLSNDDCLILTADHGCDPTVCGSDHTREYVPILVYAKRLNGGVNLGTRSTLADMGQTIADNFSLNLPFGTSFLSDLDESSLICG